MNAPFFISSSQVAERPASLRTMYCDGSADDSYRDGVDLELSHWVPNRTPEEFKADTSTEICLRFLESPSRGEWDLVVNNHADVDGILSVFTLVEPETALAHRRTLIEAAEIGDFWAWGERPAQVLFQGLTLLMNDAQRQEADPQELYEQAIARIPPLLAGDDALSGRIEEGLAHLEASLARIDSGEILREEHGPRLVHYRIAGDLAQNVGRAMYVPGFNEAISDVSVLWPQARARRDEQKVTLVSVETNTGWYYDLWYPGYTWAETPERWRPPGLTLTGSANGYEFEYPPLNRSLAELQSQEQNPGTWTLVQEVAPFAEMNGRGFPVIASILDGRQRAAASSLKPSSVAAELSKAFS